MMQEAVTELSPGFLVVAVAAVGDLVDHQ
jgi:hypothetical protein